MRTFFEVRYKALNGFTQQLLKLIFGSFIRPRSGIVRISNFLSVSRIPIALAVLLMEYYEIHPNIIVTVYLLGAYTDLLDGAAAQIEGPTPGGAVLDPVCDKLYGVICGIVLFPQMNPYLIVPLLICEALFLGAPIYLYFFAKEQKSEDLKSGIWGKARFMTEALALPAFMLNLPLVGNSLFPLALVFAGGTIVDAWHRRRTYSEKLALENQADQPQE